MPASRSRILVGPFEGHLSHQAVRDAFRPYGIPVGGWYLYTKAVPRTYGWVEFDTEAEANRAIEALRNGRFDSYSKMIRMVTVEAAGRLPMRLDEWIEELRVGWYDETKPNPVKSSDPADVDAGNSIKPPESPNPSKLHDPTDIDTSDKDEQVALIPSHVETRENPDADVSEKTQPAVTPQKTEP